MGFMRSEDYFSSDGDLDRWIGSIERKRTWKGGLGKTCLIIADMQRYFMDPDSHAYIASSESVLNNIMEILEVYDGPVIFTRHVDDAGSDNLMLEWWKGILDGEMSEIDRRLDLTRGRVLVKKHYSAFFGTDLEKILKVMGIETVVITGLMADLCCETTARDAFMRGFKVVVLLDCTATENLERHLCSLRSISKGFGEVLTSEEFRLRS